MVTIQIPKNVYQQMRQHLLPRRSRDEQAGFLYAKSHFVPGISLSFQYVKWEPLSRGAFDHQSALHLELQDETKARVIKTAHDLQCSLIEFHSHRGPWPAEFSGSDLIGFGEFVPHVLWRLKGRPYAAVVVAASGIDGLAWTADNMLPISAVLLGDRQIRPTGRSFSAISGGIPCRG